MKTQIRLVIASRNSFATRNLSVHPDLVGAVHEFPFEQHKITIALPSQLHVPSEANQGEFLAFNHYEEVNGKKTPLQLWVYAVDVEVAISEKVSVPAEILERQPNAFDIVSDELRKTLDRLTTTYKAVSEKAFDLWIRTLRWKCDNSAIGRPEIMGYKSRWSTYLVAQPEKQPIWIPPMVVQSKCSRIVTPAIWEEAGSSLKLECPPPVYIDLMMDAEEHIKRGDLQRAILDMAMACESFLRAIVAKSLPATLQTSIATHIDEANIRPVLEKFIPDMLSETEREGFKKIKSKLNELFTIRNTVAHKGRSSGLTEEQCDGFLKTTRLLIALRPLL